MAAGELERSNEIGTNPVRRKTRAGDASPRQRHDAFDGRRKSGFLKALGKYGCVLDACRKVGVSHQTVYNHQAKDPEFARNCELALRMAAVPIELSAWERAVVGVEEEVIQYGKVVGTKLKRSDSVMRLLLQGADRKKYGPRPSFTRKQLMAHEREEIERQVRAELTRLPNDEEVREALATRLAAFGARQSAERLAAGWVETEDGHLIPPGWVRAESGNVGDST